MRNTAYLVYPQPQSSSYNISIFPSVRCSLQLVFDSPFLNIQIHYVNRLFSSCRLQYPTSNCLISCVVSHCCRRGGGSQNCEPLPSSATYITPGVITFSHHILAIPLLWCSLFFRISPCLSATYTFEGG